MALPTPVLRAEAQLTPVPNLCPAFINQCPILYHHHSAYSDVLLPSSLPLPPPPPPLPSVECARPVGRHVWKAIVTSTDYTYTRLVCNLPLVIHKCTNRL